MHAERRQSFAAAHNRTDRCQRSERGRDCLRSAVLILVSPLPNKLPIFYHKAPLVDSMLTLKVYISAALSDFAPRSLCLLTGLRELHWIHMASMQAMCTTTYSLLITSN